MELATEYGRYGYRRVSPLLRGEGWPVNHKRVETIWRQEGLKVPQKQPKRRKRKHQQDTHGYYHPVSSAT
jgi:transposase InsO family protein